MSCFLLTCRALQKVSSAALIPCTPQPQLPSRVLVQRWCCVGGALKEGSIPTYLPVWAAASRCPAVSHQHRLMSVQGRPPPAGLSAATG